MERIKAKKTSGAETSTERPGPVNPPIHGPWMRYEKGRKEVYQAEGPLNYRVRLNSVPCRDYFVGNIQIGHARKNKDGWTIFTHNGLEETSLLGVSFINDADLHKWLLGELGK